MATTMVSKISLCAPIKAHVQPQGLGRALPQVSAPRRAVRMQRVVASASAEKVVCEAKSETKKSALATTAMTAAAAVLLAQVGPAHADDAAVVVEALEAWDSTTSLIVAAEYVAILGGYLVVAPVCIYAYLRARWFKRGAIETVFQFSLVFFFFPGLFLSSPFLNFRPKNIGDITDEPIVM
mmetsp:Transcript_27395/g.45835  ORF Transcript_27395/g.45835 Transcript_27395/m.45835 type:complete len:181 (+) Transcript_27395:71-613(+)|eukprot:CAMPEP_0198210746 /NCGR_PEP_ID=MMETSP1445-20131203/22152_1 /TAXON_ID=36898 /ORGANISM="Pyramimonas sp., Strain CCMP2087" /LENGTH=180 /DNA_ID=CAMNT_0043884887 /DNA_START=71 /DNA_END=613 /DNA_ORIENTATION=+